MNKVLPDSNDRLLLLCEQNCCRRSKSKGCRLVPPTPEGEGGGEKFKLAAYRRVASSGLF